MCQNSNSSNNNHYNSKFNVSLLATTTNSNNIEPSVGSSSNNNVFFVKKQSNVSYVSASANPLIATVVTHNGETKVTPRTSSPLGSLLSTSNTSAATGKVRMQQIQQQKCVRLTRVSCNKSYLFRI